MEINYFKDIFERVIHQGGSKICCHAIYLQIVHRVRRLDLKVVKVSLF